jgi:hypothetical protein
MMAATHFRYLVAMLRFVGFSQTRAGRNNPMARDWRVESLRLTLFSSENITVSDADWSGITGQQDADTRQKLPGGLRYIGRFAAGQLTVAALGQRLDVVLSWVPSERLAESPSIELPDIGAWEGVRDIFVTATQKWLESLKFPVIRIAFAPILLAETANVVESYGVTQGHVAISQSGYPRNARTYISRQLARKKLYGREFDRQSNNELERDTTIIGACPNDWRANLDNRYYTREICGATRNRSQY